MSTYQTVETQYVAVDNTRIAYRRIGVKSQVPLLYINHLRGSMDTLDPLLFNTIAKSREVIVYDSFGIGHSEGEVPSSTEIMASIAAKFLATLGVSKADVIGFSMGGGVAQILAWDYPQLVRKLILAGTQPGVGEGVVLPPREVLESAGTANDEPPTKEDMFHLFYHPSETSVALGEAWWKRIHERKVDGEERREYLIGPGARAQLNAIFSFTVDTDNFERMKTIKAPTLVTNGHTDIMSPTSNSFTLQQNLSDAQLIIYPDAGHDLNSEQSPIYSKLVKMHLSPFFQLIVAALITPGMALPTEVKETGQAAINHAPPTAMANSISAKEFDGTMTTVSTSTRCIHASLRPFCPALCGITSIAGDDVYWECVRGCDCRSKKHGGY
ncbi:hypothetical protein CMEL01_03489 [Colletotrichum melonis]|uniref:AB hydrolase-1 domain-containing protein n=1 Tax=Colletotrichum melonis TaxID=1209925 RepID=A0AAI9UAH6_9PEZI|nr:hypothetical protein CMEL01_03489 [Colletotrichum melonis]